MQSFVIDLSLHFANKKSGRVHFVLALNWYPAILAEIIIGTSFAHNSLWNTINSRPKKNG